MAAHLPGPVLIGRAPAQAEGLPRRAGLGLKSMHFVQVVETWPALGFFEIHAENYLVEGGPFHHYLTRIHDRYPLSIHGVGLSIGGEAPLDADHLDALAGLIGRYEPQAFSEHLAWSSHDGAFLNDLLPLPYDAETLQRVCDHIDQVQGRLKRPMLLENPATYVEFADSTLGEAEFIAEAVRRTGCGLLLDVSNAYVSCLNHGRDPLALIEALPLEAVGEIHLAGFAVETDAAGDPLLIDTHGTAVAGAVWDLYAQVIARLGPRPTLIERDNATPPLEVLLAEARQAEVAMDDAQHSWRMGERRHERPAVLL